MRLRSRIRTCSTCRTRRGGGERRRSSVGASVVASYRPGGPALCGFARGVFGSGRQVYLASSGSFFDVGGRAFAVARPLGRRGRSVYHAGLSGSWRALRAGHFSGRPPGLGVHGAGLGSLKEPDTVSDCGNAGHLGALADRRTCRESDSSLSDGRTPR